MACSVKPLDSSLACAARPQPSDADTQPADADIQPTAYEQCMTDDAVVRVGPATCSDPYPPSHESSCSAGYGVCSTNSDCNDADCDPGRVCLCAPLDEGTLCIEADCQTDADCDPGYRFALSPGNLWYGNGRASTATARRTSAWATPTAPMGSSAGPTNAG